MNGWQYTLGCSVPRGSAQRSPPVEGLGEGPQVEAGMHGAAVHRHKLRVPAAVGGRAGGMTMPPPASLLHAWLGTASQYTKSLPACRAASSTPP